uniref:EGF-like domain-containing protein n=1 Tax=Romanomermis culicivorax TaxID=13658 RepID=A0A915JZ79_ROMCU
MIKLNSVLVSSICKRSEMFYCQNNAYCVRLADLLNKIQNCPDNSDERFEYVDFCYLGMDTCSANAVCQRTTYEPFYECICKFALNGNGTSCSAPHSRK